MITQNTKIIGNKGRAQGVSEAQIFNLIIDSFAFPIKKEFLSPLLRDT